jgi:uncharacterized protein YcfL
MKHVTIVTAVCLGGLVGCQSTGQQLSNEQQQAIDTSLKSARVDMNCPSASGKVLSKQMVQSTSEGFGVARAEYTVHVEGCGKKKPVMVICPQDGSGCFVGGPHD